MTFEPKLFFINLLSFSCTAFATHSTEPLLVPLATKTEMSSVDSYQTLYNLVDKKKLLSPPTLLGQIYIDNQPLSHTSCLDLESMVTPYAHKILNAQDYAYLLSLCSLQPALSHALTKKNNNTLSLYLYRSLIFDRLTIKGPLFGQNRYKMFYQIRRGEKFDEQKHLQSLAIIQQALRDDGYPNATIHDVLCYKPLLHALDCTLTIKTHKRFKVSKIISLINKESFNKKSHALFYPLLKGLERLALGAYATQSLINKLTDYTDTYLAEHGFYNYHIALNQEVQQEQASVILALAIEAHHQKHMVIKGNSAFSSKVLYAHLIPNPEVLGLVNAHICKEILLRYYTGHGFYSTRIDASEDDATIYLTIKEGERSPQEPNYLNEGAPEPKLSNLFGEKTLPPTPEKSIQEPLWLYSGIHTINPKHLSFTHTKSPSHNEYDTQATKRKILKTGLFERVEVNQYSINNHPVIHLQLYDAPSLRFGVRGGLSFSGARLDTRSIAIRMGIDGTYKNLTSHGDMASIHAHLSRYVSDALVSYKVLVPNHKHPIWSETRLCGNHNFHPLFYGSLDPLFISHLYTLESSLQCTADQAQLITTAGFYGISLHRLAYETLEKIHFCPHKPYEKGFYCEPLLWLRFLDNEIDPHRGWYNLTSLRMVAPVVGNTTKPYAKCFAETACFVPLGTCTLATRLKAGIIVGKPLEYLIPTERFYLGGARSIRGWAPDECPPGFFCRDCHHNYGFVAAGGKYMGCFNTELRVPVWTALSVVPFFDYGILTQDIDLQNSSWHGGSVGCGARVQTPIGPLAFDVGYKINRARDDAYPIGWHCTLGHAF